MTGILDRRRAAVAVLLSSMAFSCRESDTIVVVEVDVDRPPPRPVVQFVVEATVDGEMRTIRVPGTSSEVLAFPTNFTLQIPRATTGTLSITVIARDSTLVEVMRGSGTIPDLAVGGTNRIRVVLGLQDTPPDAGVKPDAPPDVSPPPPDAGVDAAEDAPPPDAAADAEPADAPPDAGIDAAEDAPADAPVDAPPADTLDAPPEVGADSRDGAAERADGPG